MEKGKTILIEINKLVITDQPIEPVGTEDVERLKQSIRTIGLLYPLLISALPDSDTFEVLDGRTRLGALKELGYTAVECSLADPALYTVIIPYETELCRRHLNTTQKKHYEKMKDSLVASSVHSILDRLIPTLRDKASNMLKNSDVTKEEIDLITSWAYLSEDRQENALERLSAAAVETAAQEYEEELKDIKASKKEIEGELEEARAQLNDKEKEFEQRLKDFADEAKDRVQDMQESNLEKANENYKKLQADLEKKKDDIESLKRQLKDTKAENESYEENIALFRETLEKATDIDKTIRKFEGVCDDLRTLNELIVERNFTLKEIGAEKKSQIKKILAEIQDVLSETANIVKEIA